MQKYFFIRHNSRYVKINFNDIYFVEAARNYLKIVTEKRSYMTLMSMKQLEQLLPADLFVRIHRSYIVSLDHVTEFTRDIVFFNNKQLPIGNQYKGQLEKAVNIFSEDCFEQPTTVPLAYITQKAYAV